MVGLHNSTMVSSDIFWGVFGIKLAPLKLNLIRGLFY